MNIRLLSFVFILGIILVGCSGSGEENVEKEEGIKVEVLSISREEIRLYLDFAGVLQPLSTVQVLAESPGIVESLLVREGDIVLTDQPLAQVDDTDYRLGVDQASAALDLARASYENVRANLHRQEELFRDGFISEAVLEGIQTQHDITWAGVRQAQAAYDMGIRQLSKTSITAPIPGYVSQRFIELGQMIGMHEPAYTLQQIDKLKIQLALNGEQIQQITTGSTVDILSEYFPGQSFSGRIEFVGQTPAYDGSYPIRIEMNNQEGALLAGWPVTVRLYQSSETQEIVVPGMTLSKKSGRWLAFTVRNGRAEERQVELLGQIQEQTIIASGFDGDEVLIVRGQAYCKSGEPVDVVKTWDSMDQLLQAAQQED